MSFRPMLAYKEPIFKKGAFPYLASPKIDGIRGVVLNGRLVSRTLKPFPNKFVSEDFSHSVLNGLDGELVCGEPNIPGVLERTKSAVSTIEGCPEVIYWVFDDFTEPYTPFCERYEKLKKRVEEIGHPRIKVVPHWQLDNMEHVEACENYILDQGFEGLMIRTRIGNYVFGRCNKTNPHLAKMKRFNDEDAICIGYFEEMENQNPSTENALGLTTRSHEQAGMVGKDRLGGLILRTEKGEEFRVGSGFTETQRIDFWKYRDQLPGHIVTFKHFKYGAKDKPRHPVFIGFRLREVQG